MVERRLTGEDTPLARDHLANERTYLAWLRTAINVMILGVAVAKLVHNAGARADGVIDCCRCQSTALVAFFQHSMKGYPVEVLVKRWLKSLRQLFSQPRRRPIRRTRPGSRG